MASLIQICKSMGYNKSLRLPFLMLALLTILTSRASSQSAMFRLLEHQPASKLLSEGLRYTNDPEKPDSALLTLSVLVNRYDKNMSETERLDIARAYTYQAFVYLFRYYDYAKAYRCLLRAREISENAGKELPTIYLYLGQTFGSIGEQSDDREYISKALWCMRKALKASIADNNQHLANIAFGNAISLAWRMNRLQSIEEDWNIFKKLKDSDSREFTQFNKLYYLAIQSIMNKNYEKALSYFNMQQNIMQEDLLHVRYICLARFNKARTCALSSNYKMGILNLKSCLSLGRKFDLKDVNLETCKYLSDYYSLLGQNDSSMEYRNQYLALKDTLIGYRQTASIKEMSFMNDLEKVNELMAKNKLRQHRLVIVAWGLAIIVVIITTFLALLYWKNLELKNSYQSLFNKNQDILKLEEKNKLLQQGDKYKNSKLDNDEKQNLFKKIEHVLSTDQSVYSQNFTLSLLSSIVDSNYKNVSQVINEVSGCNFNALLNEYRIMEACRRINDEEHYINLTLEAIAVSVGFKSRSTFLKAFKRFTGLTPSEYIRIKKCRNLQKI